MKKLIFFSLMALFCFINVYPQESQVEINHEGKDFTSLKHAWSAQWITADFSNRIHCTGRRFRWDQPPYQHRYR